MKGRADNARGCCRQCGRSAACMSTSFAIGILTMSERGGLRADRGGGQEYMRGGPPHPPHHQQMPAPPQGPMPPPPFHPPPGDQQWSGAQQGPPGGRGPGGFVLGRGGGRGDPPWRHAPLLRTTTPLRRGRERNANQGISVVAASLRTHMRQRAHHVRKPCSPGCCQTFRSHHRGQTACREHQLRCTAAQPSARF